MYVQRNTEARSCKQCCNGKAVSITYSESESVALGIQQAMRTGLTVISGLSGCKKFLSRKRYDFRNKMLVNLKCVLLFYLQLCSETFLILRKIQGDIKGKGKVHPCTGTEALYRPYGS